MPPAGLKHIIACLDALPAPGAVATRILSMASKEDVNLSELIDLLEAEPSLSAALLRLANTAANTIGDEVRDVDKAAMRLGLDTVRTVALCVAVRDGLFGRSGPDDPHVRAVWEHSLACAVAANLLAKMACPALAGQAFAAGLLHDCGRLALLAALPKEYDALLAMPHLAGESFLETEQRLLGADHCLTGKWLLERWNLPEVFVEAAWLHHQPAAGLDRTAAPAGKTVLCVALADHLAHAVMGDPPSPGAAQERIRLAGLLGLGGEAALNQVSAQIGTGFAERAALFNLSDDAAGFYYQALRKANQRLGQNGLALTRRSEELERARIWLEGVAGAGVLLGGVADWAGILREVARTMAGVFGSPEGMAYILDPEAGLLLAQPWGEAERNGQGRLPSPVTCRLDATQAPMEAQTLPPGPRALLAGAHIRAGAMAGTGISSAGDSGPLHRQEGYVIAAIPTRDQGLAEIIFRPALLPLAPLEQSACRHLADLAGAAYARLRLLEQCRKRAENLAEAMRAMQGMNLKLLQTERLAAVGQLAAGAAHEINNPLAIISARAQLLEMKEPDPAKKRNFQQMVEQIERISAILGNLMDFARPAPLSMEPVDIVAVLGKTLELIAGGLKPLGIGLERHFPQDLPAIQADPRQLEQVFLNLLINAEHAMEGTGGTISLSVAYAPRNDTLTVSITDTGTGIPKELLGKIFDPFFTTKAEGKGTGLGLSTSYGIVANHLGDILVDSEPGRGTTVTVRLPRDPAAARASAGASASAAHAGPAQDAILVVDDEKHIRDILRESLESEGYAVALAKDGEQGLSMLRTQRFRLVILDIRMPQRDGLELLREARSLVGEGLPVLVLTGMAGEEEIREALDLGAAGCLRKPFQIDALLAEVRRLGGRRDAS